MKVNLGYLSAATLALVLGLQSLSLAQTITQTKAPLSIDGQPFTTTANDLVISAGSSSVQDENNVTAPVYASGGCTTTPVITGSPYAFTFTQGASGCSGSTLTLSLPTAGYNTKWVCDAHDITSPTTTMVEQSAAASATSVQFTNYTRTTGVALTWVASDVILVKCSS